MKWILRLSAVAFLLFCFSFSAYSQDEKADITKAELQAMFQELDRLSAENQSLTDDYNELNQKYLTALTEHKSELMKLQQEVKLMEIESQVRLDALKKLESETIWTDIGNFLAGVATGYGLNELKADIINIQLSP